ncbi:hypothetical protein EWB00_001203 [Schistosoma japonicum]|uniref:Uncharacterized protein n=1 Tax=Schistosoma japonicum TaxID=6182 RepID=A0A4Z2DHA2_SCHJA|nr:hypothetical protein EWB00_001203 [Schistosoma japonicum]
MKAQSKSIECTPAIRKCNPVSSGEEVDILKLKITNELESKYHEEILILKSNLHCCQEENCLLLEEIQNLNKTLIDERIKFKNLTLFYETEISSLKKIKNDQSIQINQLSSLKIDDDKQLLLHNAQLQAKCQELDKQLNYYKENLSTEGDKIQSRNLDQLTECSEIKSKNIELQALCYTQKNQLNILTEEVNNLRIELEKQRQTSLESTKRQINAELQVEKLLHSTRSELFNLRMEAQAQRLEIDKQRDESMKNSKAMEHELNLLSSRLTNTNLFPCYHLEQLNNNIKEDDEKIQYTIQLFRDYFMMHINEFENKVTSITNRLNLEVNQMQTFKMYANSLMEKIRPTESQQKSLILTDSNHYKISKHLDLNNAVRYQIRQYIEDSRKKKRALCLRIVLMKRKINFLEYEIEKLRKENNDLRNNVSTSEYERLCTAYKDLYRRHQEYERIILNSDNQKFLTQHI